MNPAENLTYRLGSPKVATRPLVPYDPTACDFLNDLSTELHSSREAGIYSDVMAFAFWCRKANILKLKEEFQDDKTRLGLGIVFHVAPSNVPINFAFSFAFGLLAGNANIVRIPSKPFPQTDVVCAALRWLFEKSQYSEIKSMTAFVQYERNDEITGLFSSNCNARILWGGDETIRTIRKAALPERSVEIAFADRYSICIIDAPSVLKTSEAELRRLADNFYNDTYLMDQNACSSPHLVLWQGRETELAKNRFWVAIYRTATEKYQLEPVQVMDKYTRLCHDAVERETIGGCQRYGNLIYRLPISRLPDNIDSWRGQYGYFYEYDLRDENEIASIVNPKYQTLTYFGVDKTRLRDLVVKHRLTGIDRIVPIGKALDIGVIWDGYDVIRSLSRIIDVR